MASREVKVHYGKGRVQTKTASLELEKAGMVLPAHIMAMTLAVQKMHERPV